MYSLSHPARRRAMGVVGAALLGAALGAPAMAADKYPSRPIRIVVPLPAGGPADALMRIHAQQLSKVLKQAVIIENKPGGSYVIGMHTLAAAPADGYTLLAVNVSMISTQVTLKKIDLLKSLVPIGRFVETPAMLAVSGKSAHKSMGDLVSYGKAHPGRMAYGVGGAGSVEHLLCVMMENTAGYKATVVPYKGTVEGVTALVQGDIDYQVMPLPLVAQFIPKGQMRGLAVFSAQRLKDYPDVPTITEAGIPQTPFTIWGGLAAPAGTPPEIVQMLHRAMTEASASPEVQTQMATIGAVPTSSASPQTFAKEIADELDRMASAVKAGNIRLEP